MNFLYIYLELYEAIKRDDLTKAKNVCLRAKGNLNFLEVLVFAVENNMNEAFNMLWENGAQLNIYSDLAIKLLLTALANQNIVLFEKLLSTGITKNTEPSPILSLVIVENFQKGTINAYNFFKKSFENTRFWKKLVKNTLIHFVIERKNLTSCQILITDGFDVNLRDDSGYSPVHVAAREGDSLIMKQLIKNNATINATNHANQTPLHLAAKNGHKGVFDILKGFDVDDVRDNDGKTAKDYALEQGHYDKLFLEYLSLYS